ncbi:hypothetical protein [Marinobacter sp. CHS3-4]|uniref:hypothetical protein n=1 Tax=Marinobacter sp. CHS3-4 TaxID=3045174 RepID=UPI0024B49CE0|nr:hypothetical protein [Marinobacter sp. CHS3-4]MDI9243832.1 hypothetical protein [Marinobacter sp. CHS3-4]
MLELIFTTVLVANALWFGAAFRVFWLKGPLTSNMLIRREERDSPLRETVIASGRFLGGMNLGFSVFSVLLILFLDHFSQPIQIFVCCIAFCVAHGSQFAGNVPPARQERRGETPVWPVLRGPMLFIFVVDLIMAAVNGGVALIALGSS